MLACQNACHRKDRYTLIEQSAVCLFSDCSIRVYQSFYVLCILISKILWQCINVLPIMLALCSMLSGTYYAHYYASIIGGSLDIFVLFLYLKANKLFYIAIKCKLEQPSCLKALVDIG